MTAEKNYTIIERDTSKSRIRGMWRVFIFKLTKWWCHFVPYKHLVIEKFQSLTSSNKLNFLILKLFVWMNAWMNEREYEGKFWRAETIRLTLCDVVIMLMSSCQQVLKYYRQGWIVPIADKTESFRSVDPKIKKITRLNYVTLLMPSFVRIDQNKQNISLVSLSLSLFSYLCFILLRNFD